MSMQMGSGVDILPENEIGQIGRHGFPQTGFNHQFTGCVNIDELKKTEHSGS
jgi:hypothetical protein